MSVITWAVVLLAGVSCTLAAGVQTSLEEHPSIVQVEDRVALTWLQQCAGIVVTNYHVMSTASCFIDENPEIRRIRAGASTRGVGGIVMEIARITHHPSYGMIGQDGDIAMVMLSSALTLSPTIQQAAIIGEGIYLPTNLKMTIVGWGTTTEGGLVGNDELYKKEVLTVDEDTCLEKYITQNIVTENMICVRQSDTEGLNYDSRDAGSPVIYEGTTTGIISFGVSRGNDEFPVVATAITSYTSWVVEEASKL